MNYAATIPSRAVRALAVAIILLLAVIWALGMSGVIHLPLALILILPLTCVIIGAILILWEGGAFDNR